MSKKKKLLWCVGPPFRSNCRSDYPPVVMSYLDGTHLVYDAHKCLNLYLRKFSQDHCNCTTLSTFEGDILYDWSAQAICDNYPAGRSCVQQLLNNTSTEEAFIVPDCRAECLLTKYQVKGNTLVIKRHLHC